jgi:hypothetical protein
MHDFIIAEADGMKQPAIAGCASEQFTPKKTGINLHF